MTSTIPATVQERYTSAFQANDPEHIDRLFDEPAPWHAPPGQTDAQALHDQVPIARLFGGVQPVGRERFRVELADVHADGAVDVQWLWLRAPTPGAVPIPDEAVGCRLGPGGLVHV